MQKEELEFLTQQALQQIETTTNDFIMWSNLIEGSKHMRANEDAQIYEHLHHAFRNILEPNIFPTILDPQGHKKARLLTDSKEVLLK